MRLSIRPAFGRHLAAASLSLSTALCAGCGGGGGPSTAVDAVSSASAGVSRLPAGGPIRYTPTWRSDYRVTATFTNATATEAFAGTITDSVPPILVTHPHTGLPARVLRHQGQMTQILAPVVRNQMPTMSAVLNDEYFLDDAQGQWLLGGADFSGEAVDWWLTGSTNTPVGAVLDRLELWPAQFSVGSAWGSGPALNEEDLFFTVYYQPNVPPTTTVVNIGTLLKGRRVLRTETIDTALGLLEAYVVQINDSQTDRDGFLTSIQGTLWMRPDVGMLRTQLHGKTGYSTPLFGDITYEITAHQP